jgi:hypothetical protein
MKKVPPMTGSRSEGTGVRTKHTTDKEANMRLDLYTKAVLTVIACCLLYLCFVSRPQIVHADGPQHVLIDGLAQGASFPTVIAGVWQDSSNPFALPVIAVQNIPVSVMNIGGQDVASGAIPVVNTHNPGNPIAIPLTVMQAH